MRSFRVRLSNVLLALLVWGPLAGGALSSPITAQSQETDAGKLEQERLRGSVTPERAWWDLKHYDLAVRIDIENRNIAGRNTIRFQPLEPGRMLQVDLQPPLEITAVSFAGQSPGWTRNGNVYLIELPAELATGETYELTVEYQGQPTESKNPPWSGGFSWQKDSSGKPFVATSCQGIGASIWWPCKDHGYDEPEEGADIRLTVPAGLVAVSNGRLVGRSSDSAGNTDTFHWRVTQPINNYSINANIGDYVNFGEKIQAEEGPLDLDYWVLREQLDVAKEHFKEAKRTIEAFEYWFGPYPFREDSYKLVEVPYLGMEHQSSVTYGNGYRNGYRGRDLSGTGVGMKFDFIIVHESGHEWFGNNISMQDAADMWIHESFTNYSENLFVEYHFSQQEAEDYVIGCRKLVRNDTPIIGEYGLNRSGSGDMYYKGGNMLHTLRHMLNDTARWREILRGLNREFRHQTVTTEQVEQYLARETGLDLSKFFDQYLRGTEIPVFEYALDGDKLTYRFAKVVPGFSIPLRVIVNGEEITLHPTEQQQVYQASGPIRQLEVNRNFYVLSQAVEF